VGRGTTLQVLPFLVSPSGGCIMTLAAQKRSG